MKKKIQLTVETHELLVIKRAKNLTQTWCGECAGHVPLIRPEAAAVLARVKGSVEELAGKFPLYATTDVHG